MANAHNAVYGFLGAFLKLNDADYRLVATLISFKRTDIIYITASLYIV
jgi:hypothetical protein